MSNHLLEIKKIKSWEDIFAVVLVEKSEKVPAAKNENLVDQCGNINMFL